MCDILYQSLIEKIVNRPQDFVPILGEEMFVVGNQTFQEYLINEFNTCSYLTIPIRKEEIGNWYRLPFYTLLSKFQKRLKRPKEFESLYRAFVLKALKNGILRLNDSISNFLKIADFPFILTTHCFSSIENSLNNASSGLEFTSVWHRWGQNDETNKIPSQTDSHIIYHLFGEANSRWVYNEKILLECMHSLQNASKALSDFLRDKHLLCLGCALPDWLFRFLWYPMTKSKGGSQYPDTISEGLWASQDENEAFNDFLEEIGLMRTDDLNSFIQDLSEAFRNRNGNHLASSRHSEYKYDVFLSYKREDEEIALKIHKKLIEHGLLVWRDTDSGTGRLQSGGSYWDRIQKGIEESRYFMPVVSSKYFETINEVYVDKLECNTIPFIGLIEENERAVQNWIRNKERWKNETKDGIAVYSLPVIDIDRCDMGKLLKRIDKGAFPKELFDGIQMYFYSMESNSSDTFHSHNWSNYKLY